MGLSSVSSTFEGRNLTLYSRRQFLQLSGIACISAQFQFSWLTRSSNVGQQGRALEATPAHSQRNLRSPVVGYLWPDCIVSIYGADSFWYEVPNGYVPRSLVQPMASYEPAINLRTPTPFWAEVAAPVAPVRQWCAADAPPVTRIGHCGVIRVIDSLPADRTGSAWYGLESHDGGLLGWTQAVFWRPVNVETFNAPYSSLLIDRRLQLLTAFEQDEVVLQAQVSLAEALEPGNYPISGREMRGAPVNVSGYEHLFHGAPWRIRFGENHELMGVYWHNRFGAPTPGPSIQVAPTLARWLYSWLGDDGLVVVT